MSRCSRNICTLLLLILLLTLAAGCADRSDLMTVSPIEKYQVPEPDYWPTEQWKTADPAAMGMNADKLGPILNELKSRPINAMVIVKKGYIVGQYYKDGNPDRIYPVHSVAKSITSALTGIAVDQGFIHSTDDPVLNYFADIPLEDEKAKRKITLKHLLAMNSGINWPEWTTWNFSLKPLHESKDWNAFVLQRPIDYPPGEVFIYNTGGSQLLAGILKKTTGKSEYEFAKQTLFEPIGITHGIEWIRSPDGSNGGGFGLRMTPGDEARFGFLYLHGGKWDDKQIVPEDWVKESTRLQSEGHPWFGQYGLHWWLTDFDGVAAFYAMGFAGQYIYVVPELDLVVVISSNSPEDTTMPQPIMSDIIGASASP